MSILKKIEIVKSCSLPKNCKLHNATEFKAVINNKCQVHGDLIQIYIKPNKFGHARFGLIVAKKIERRAVRRNRIKRLLRETFRKQRVNKQIPSWDWVIRLKRSISRDESTRLIAEMQFLMIKLQQCHD